MRPERLLTSASARLALIYSTLVLVAFVLAGVGAWVTTKSAAEHQIRERVQLEMNALISEMRTEGDAAAVAAIRSRSESPGALDYVFVDRNGAAMVQEFDARNVPLGWNALDLPDTSAAEGSSDFLVLSARTPDGGRLTIGDNNEDAERVRNAVLNAIFGVGVVAMVLALVAGGVAARAAWRRTDALAQTMARVSAGDLSARAPERVGGDDIDAIGRGVNAMLGRIDTLVTNLRHVSTDIAHDLRTPLTQVRNQLESAASADPAAAQEAIRVAQSKIDGVLRTFAAIMRLAEIEAGGARSRFAPLDLAAVAERVADAYRPDVESNGHPFAVESRERITLRGDADLIAQALGNLIENAMRYAGGGALINIGLSRSDGAIRLWVEDRGQGIAAENRERATEAFVRLDPSRTEGGAGLGLAIVKAIAELHGATFRLEDAEPGLRAIMLWETRD